MTLTVLRNGRVHTAADPEATALAITDGTISWVGGEHAVDTAGRPDRVIDLAGSLVVPGFVDAHVHTLDAGLALTGLDLSGTRSLAECLRAVREYAGTAPDGVVWGHGWEDTRWPEGRPPTRSELDEAVGGRPAYLSRIDVHSAQLSTALAARIEARSDGWSDVVPVTRQAHAAVRAAARDMLTAGQRRAAHLAFLQACAAQGIVEVHECAADGPSGLADLRALLELNGPIPVRGYLARAVTDPDEARAALVETGAHALGGDLVVDGAIGSRTAALTHPYADDPGNRGARYLTDEQIVEHLVACTAAGVQAGFHAIGDDAVSAVGRSLLAAADRLGENATVRLAARAHRVEHAEMADAQAIAAFARTGAVAGMQPMFDAAWGGPDGLYARRLGVDRAAPMNDLAALAAAGVALAFGSDAPVTPVGPWSAVQAAVHHRTPGRGLSPRAAFTAHTRGGHRAAGRMDREVGTINPGAPAHLAIVQAGELVRPAADPSVARWSTDPRSRVPLLPDLTPGAPLPITLATLVAGRVAYDAGLFG